MKPERLLTIAQVAERLAVSERFVRRLVERHEIASHRLGRAVRISDEAVAEYLAMTETPADRNAERRLRAV